MALSSVSVVVSALALKSYNRFSTQRDTLPRVNRNTLAQDMRKLWNERCCRRHHPRRPTAKFRPVTRVADVEVVADAESGFGIGIGIGDRNANANANSDANFANANANGIVDIPYFCRMEEAGNPDDCDCPAASCTCDSCTVHDTVTNSERRREEIRHKRQKERRREAEAEAEVEAKADGGDYILLE